METNGSENTNPTKRYDRLIGLDGLYKIQNKDELVN